MYYSNCYAKPETKKHNDECVTRNANVPQGGHSRSEMCPFRSTRLKEKHQISSVCLINIQQMGFFSVSFYFCLSRIYGKRSTAINTLGHLLSLSSKTLPDRRSLESFYLSCAFQNLSLGHISLCKFWGLIMNYVSVPLTQL